MVEHLGVTRIATDPLEGAVALLIGAEFAWSGRGLVRRGAPPAHSAPRTSVAAAPRAAPFVIVAMGVMVLVAALVEALRAFAVLR